MELLPIVLSLLVMSHVEAGPHREPRQATLTTTLTVARTTTVGMYPICASLVNASRPCLGRRAVWNPDIADIKPSKIYRYNRQHKLYASYICYRMLLYI